MKLSHFFIDRPVFAVVVSMLITLLGVIAYPTLPVAQYPQIVPPTVTITATYPGASAETLADTVADPIEEQINGVENMLYMSSQSTGDGHLHITVTFKLGTDPDKAQVLVENRVATATPRLPDVVRNAASSCARPRPTSCWPSTCIRRTARSTSSTSPTTSICTSATQLLRIPGVGDVVLAGGARLLDADLDRPGQGRRAQPDRRRHRQRACRPTTSRSPPGNLGRRPVRRGRPPISSTSRPWAA